MSALMLSKVKSALVARAEPTPSKVGMVVDMADSHLIGGIFPVSVGSYKEDYPYNRPEFLYLSAEDLAAALDQQIRPVLSPRFPTRMPAYAGYAECCNGGKSPLNEDQAAARLLRFQQHTYEPETVMAIETKNRNENREQNDEDVLSFSPSLSGESSPATPQLKAAYFGLFDGHAGTGAASISSNCLHEHLKNRMNEVLDTVLTLASRHPRKRPDTDDDETRFNVIDSDSLVVGALEKAFDEMDHQIAEEKQFVRIGGGCTALVALFCLNKVFVANAGDCRAVLVTGDRVLPLSADCTPMRERKRLQFLASNNEDALHGAFSRFEYSRHLSSRDVGRKVLYRDHHMDGWATKTVQEYDLRPSLISARCRKSRLLNTIGVSRGLGDHHLMTYDEKIAIKPFLSCAPEVKVFDVNDLDQLTDDDVLIMASDGLWDVLSNADVASIVRSSLSQSDKNDLSRYTAVAQELVAAARGEAGADRKWRLSWTRVDSDASSTSTTSSSSTTTTSGNSSSPQASMDDISVFAIPVKFATNLPRDEEEEDDEELLVI